MSSARIRRLSFFVLSAVLSVGLVESSANAQARGGRHHARGGSNATKPTAPPAADAVSPSDFSAPSVPSSEHLTVREINVEGQRKLEKDAIVARLKTKKGELYSPGDVREDVLSLFKLGYFNDVQVDRKVDGSNVDLTYRVVEKPSMAEIVYEGNSDVKTEDLQEASGLKAYQILNEAKVREAVDKLQKYYEDKGFFLARVDSKIEDIKKDESVKVIFRINEAEKVKVKKVIFVGNKKVTDAYLKDRMFTKEEGYFSFISGSGAYKQEAFERDIVALRMSYYNQGYIQAKIDRPQVSVTPDKKGIYLTFRIEEGNQYSVGDVDFAGDLLFSKQELYDSIKIDKNGVFAYDVLQRDMAELQAKYGDLGYAYTNVIPRWQFNEPEKKVNLIFEIDKGNKVYFGRIDMVGNTKTRDKVIRRELKIREGELYNETRRRQSVENVQRLGFFDEVNFKSTTPPDRLDLMNLDIVVKERNTGQVQVSAGYGTATGFTFGGSVQQTNFLGKGQNLGVSVNVAGDYRVYDLSFTDPYFNDTQWLLGGRVFASSNSARLDYIENRKGASMSLGHPLGEYLRASVSYQYSNIELDPIYAVDTQGNNYLVTDYSLFPLSNAEGDAGTATAALEYDTRNDRMRPTKGYYARASAANTGWLGGSLHYYRESLDFRWFRNLFWDVTWRNSATWAQVSSSNDQPVPFYELYLLGGPYSLRGYRYGRVGKMLLSRLLQTRYQAAPPAGSGLGFDDATKQAMRFYGGTQELQYQTELQFPLIKEADMFGVVFYDIGRADDDLSGSFSADWGLGIRWFSPIGPLRFEWGIPFNRNPDYNESSVFEFSIGTPF